MLMSARPEIFGLKYSVVDVCHMIIFSLHFLYSYSSEDGIRKKCITLAVVRTYASFTKKLSLKEELKVSCVLGSELYCSSPNIKS